MDTNTRILMASQPKPAGPVIPGDTGLGPTELLGSYQNPNDSQKFAGYYGTITAANFFTGTQLAQAINLTTGIVINDATLWMKFILDGRILVVPQKPIRYNSFWNHLYAVGAVYGDDTTGTFPASTPVLQSAKVTKGGYSYRVRLFSGYNQDPSERTTASDPVSTHGSEWNRLMYNVCSSSTPGSQQGSKWASFTTSDLGLTGSTGSLNQVIETDGGNNSIGLIRGGTSIDGCTYGNKASVNTNGGWRPVLELITS